MSNMGRRITHILPDRGGLGCEPNEHSGRVATEQLGARSVVLYSPIFRPSRIMLTSDSLLP